MKKMNLKLHFLMVLMLSSITFGFAQQRPSFNKNKDILIAQFDSKPDPDDIHAQAALGCMLAHPDFQGVKYYAVAGAIGKQNGDFIESGNLMNMAFGQGNWTHALNNKNASINRIVERTEPILRDGGKVWVQEAGQSNITREWATILQNRLGANTVKNNVIVVQHSEWNVNLTDNTSNNAASNPAIMNWIKSNTNYFYLDDGNAGFTQAWGDHGPWQTPSYRSRDGKWLRQAMNSRNGKAKALWTEANKVARNSGEFKKHNGFPSWTFMSGVNNSNDGVDYSDTVENWWIFQIGNNADSVDKFWTRYVTNSNSNQNTGGNNNGGNNNGGNTGGNNTGGRTCSDAPDYSGRAADYSPGDRVINTNDNKLYERTASGWNFIEQCTAGGNTGGNTGGNNGGNNNGGNNSGTSALFDFGTANSPVQSGYTRITQNSNNWTNSSGLDSRDRASGPGSLPNNINRDFIFSGSAKTFEYTIANGTYDVVVTFGDRGYARPGQAVKAEGTTVVSNFNTNANQFRNATFQTTVSDGKLSLEFSVPSGVWCVTRVTVQQASGGGNNGGNNSGSGAAGSTCDNPITNYDGNPNSYSEGTYVRTDRLYQRTNSNTNPWRVITNCGSAKQLVGNDLSIKVYPNPASDIVNIDATDVRSLKVRNLVGQTILVNTNQSSINISSLASGLYILEALIENKVVTTKIVKK